MVHTSLHAVLLDEFISVLSERYLARTLGSRLQMQALKQCTHSSLLWVRTLCVYEQSGYWSNSAISALAV
eukprot:6183556-Amphidinium_carterae.1